MDEKVPYYILNSIMKHYYLLILTLLISGCWSDKAKEINRISINENELDAILIDNIFSDYKFISLEETDSSLVGAIRKIVLKNDVIYVSAGGRLFQFTTTGKHLRTLDRYGRGPEEYISIWDFIVSDKDILVWDQNSRKIIRYSLENRHIASYSLDHFAASIYLIDRDKVLFSSSYQGDDEYKFIVRDLETMDIITSFHPINMAQTTYRHVMYQDNYYVYKDALLFHEPMNNHIYEIDNHELKPIHYIDIYGKNPPEEFWEKEYEHVGDIQTIAQKNGYSYGVPIYAESENQVVFSFRSDNTSLLCSYLKRTRESVQSEKLILFPGIPAIDVSQIKFNTESEEAFLLAIESNAFYEDIDTPYAKELSYLSNNGNPVICIAKLK